DAGEAGQGVGGGLRHALVLGGDGLGELVDLGREQLDALRGDLGEDLGGLRGLGDRARVEQGGAQLGDLRGGGLGGEDALGVARLSGFGGLGGLGRGARGGLRGLGGLRGGLRRLGGGLGRLGGGGGLRGGLRR